MAIALLATTAAVAWVRSRANHVSSPPVVASGSILPDDVYIWQRAWTPEVVHAVATEHASFRRPVILAGEISLKDQSVVTVQPKWAEIAASVRDIGLAVRIGPLPTAVAAAAFAEDSPQIQLIRRVALAAINDARQANLNVAELQIDFDCAESKLAGYQRWVRALKSADAPVPVIITALPSWLKHAEFASLAREADGVVLQVHSLHRPTSPGDSMQLCDAAEASAAVTDAVRAGVPFRIALPTYSYRAGFSSAGTFLGLAGEGAHPAWPVDAIVKTMRSDPAVIARLVRNLRQRHPALLTGIIWYRLPVPGDSLNWPMPTLSAVMAGRTPLGKLDVVTAKSASGAIDIFLQNTGEADASARCEITVDCAGASLITADGINAFDRLDTPGHGVTFRPAAAAPERWIAPGDRLQTGWLRLSTDTEVHTHVEPLGPP